MDVEQRRLVNIRGLAAALGLSWTWLYGEARAGRLPYLRVGRRMLFDPEAVELALLHRAAHGLKESAHAGE